ncbi:MAG TPA: phage tail sheath C-terminal domain-containing protein [Allosphingosinicella sp.]
MFVPGVTFTTRQPASTGLSTRADVAMFVGCVGRTAAALPQPVADALAAGGWRAGGLFRTTDAQLFSLLDLPVPVTSWAEFDALYAWDERPAAPGSADLLPCPLGLAVKSFFEAGGAKAYVVRTGDPLPLVGATPDATIAAKRALLAWSPAKPPADAADRVPILAGLAGLGIPADPGDPATWSGAAAIYAIEDAAMLLLPDLAEIAAGAPRPVPPVADVPGPPEQFLPCAQPDPDAVPEPREDRPDYLAPRLDRPGYKIWAAVLASTLDLLSLPRGPAHRRDVMLVSALPLPLDDGGFDKSEENWPLAILGEPGIPGPGIALLDAASIGHPRLQLAYPWIATDASVDMPEGLQSPEGLLAGLIAARSLSAGAFRSAAGQAPRGIRRVQPELAGSDIYRGLPQGADWLGDRLCLIAPQRGRIELVSDSTMADDARLRAGGVSRLTGIILRAARHLGEDLVFEPSGPLLWSRIRAAVEGLLERLWERGALDGVTRDAAYSVRCDESTMNQADIDNGRVICTIAFTAAYPIERIEVTLLLLEPPSSALIQDAA